MNPEYIFNTMHHGSVTRLCTFCCKMYSTTCDHPLCTSRLSSVPRLEFKYPICNEATDIPMTEFLGNPRSGPVFFPTVTFQRTLLMKLMSLMIALLGTSLKYNYKENTYYIIVIFLALSNFFKPVN